MCEAFGFAIAAQSSALLTPLRGVIYLTHILPLGLTPRGAIWGGLGGKAALLPAPPQASQREWIFGKGAPEGPRFHTNIDVGFSPLNVSDGITNRIQGIRGLWHKGPY